jgi:hypothetical protein
MGTGGHFLEVKRGWGVILTTHPHLVPRSRMSRNYIAPLPLIIRMAVVGQLHFIAVYATVKTVQKLIAEVDKKSVKKGVVPN